MFTSLPNVVRIGGLMMVTSLLGCSSSPAEVQISKDQARELGGRADDGTDLCDSQGWYGDGTCDDFCPRADSDCETSDGSCGGFAGAECPAGQYCRFAIEDGCGGDDAAGRCETPPEVCPEIYSPVCGCDGKTYGNPCEASAARVSVASQGPCEKVPGKLCGTRGAGECGEGEFCDFAPGTLCGAADEGGTCRPVPEACTRELAPVCGCDGQTYSNACEANASGVSVATEGECETPEGQACGARAGDTCGETEYCYFTRQAICGRADATGTCQPRPEACSFEYLPVCGCDGQTYGNECEAASLGVGVAFDGECEPPKGKVCGGIQGASCADGEFCDFEPEAICGYADATGVCRPRPEACTRELAPVCGCDGQTYDNRCVANSAGTGVLAEGACEG